MLDIVLVEDDARLGTMVSDYLQRHGYQVAHERSGERAVARILAEKPALVLLDVGLPDQDGFEVCRQIRPHYDGIICVLTARTDNIDQVLGLELGPTITSANRSSRGCCWPGCVPTCAGTAGSSRVTAACALAN